jgi:hypothetical protein
MKEIFSYDNIGDSLSAIQFNFSCLDIKLSNLQNFVITKLSELRIDGIWNEGFSEILALSSNWQTVKEQVHNTSAYWNNNNSTVVYTTPFPQGKSNINTIKLWLNTHFPISGYPKDFKISVTYFEWYKDPALHVPAKRSERRFGKITASNNVRINKVNTAIFEKGVSGWVYTTDKTIHTEKPCLLQFGCDVCWGRAYYAEQSICIPQPTYYELECIDVPPEPEPDPCDLLDNLNTAWVYPSNSIELENSVLYQNTSSTDLSPYILGFNNSYNPNLELVVANVYSKYVNNSARPLISNIYEVDRLFGFNTQHTYEYDSNTNTYTNVSLFSSMDLNFGDENPINFPIQFKTSDITSYIIGLGLKKILNQASTDCSFTITIETSWYRWVTNNLSLSSTPYWHIGVEPGTSLGFTHNPQSGVPDSPTNWALAETSLGDGLSAYFGVFSDMMGQVKSVVIS